MTISIANSINCVGLPIIVTTSYPYLNFLIDTGANLNSIFDFVYEGLPDFFTPLESKQSQYGIEGNEMSYSMAKATIEFNDTKAETAFSVMNADRVVRRLQEDNGFQLHGILGTQFLKDNKWIIDFGKLEIIT